MNKSFNAPLSKLFDDPYLKPYRDTINQRKDYAVNVEARITGGHQTLRQFAAGHEYFGLHRTKTGWVLREWAPNASDVFMVGHFCNWEPSGDFALHRVGYDGNWEITLPHDALRHGDCFRLKIRWSGNEGDRIPAYARRVIQDPLTKIFNAQVWAPDEPYAWHHTAPPRPAVPLIYEAHVGMAQEEEGIGTYDAFRTRILPRIVEAGYNTIQLMAIMEHPYYGSFGYHVSSFFAASSRFGTPESLKALIDEAHGAGLYVIIDLIHSHCVRNEVEGLSRFDGTPFQYFHDGVRGFHPAWDSRCFDYGKPQVLHFLLSNCAFWLDEYRVDGYRFDGITSMLYLHHGLGPAFTSYDEYFNDSVDNDAVAYLTLANKLVHESRPDAITVAEDVSGMPGLATDIDQGGCGFDYRLAMGVPDCWFKLVNDTPDENWDMHYLWTELTNRRSDERTLSYVECHDQALVGGKTLIFELIDAEMYTAMRIEDRNLIVDRGLALHKMARLATLATAGHGYLTFMGNEFGHPEWIDFPRAENNWSYHYARRQWHLRDDPALRFHYLADFDRDMLRLVTEHHDEEPAPPQLLAVHNADKVMAFARGDLLFIFNFHKDRSFSDYRLPAQPGSYRLVLDSDAERFGGHGRLAADQVYFTIPPPLGTDTPPTLQVYIPCRTALVLRKDASRPQKGRS
jgi:1,4-alpha-glucan branching enzyme